ncbi:hypothetical protein D039_1183A, partial [Vibrio parahaemolyticus EKP-028]
MSIINH